MPDDPQTTPEMFAEWREDGQLDTSAVLHDDARFLWRGRGVAGNFFEWEPDPMACPKKGTRRFYKSFVVGKGL